MAHSETPPLPLPRLAVKTLDAEGYRVGGYALTFGAPHSRDLHREYFMPSTDYGLGWFNQRPVLYNHGLDPDCGADPVGVIDALKVDADGLWCEAQLNKHHRYIEAIRRLIAAGALGWSSGSLPHLVEKAADGQIKRWPLVEVSLTPTPAQPYRTTVSALKAAYAAAHLDPGPLTRIFSVMDPASPDPHPDTPAIFEETQAMTTHPTPAPNPDAQTFTQLAENVAALTDAVRAMQANGGPGPVRRLPAPTAEAQSAAPRIEVTRATKYSEFSAADLSFLYELLNGSPRGWRPDTAFFRELADKTARAVNNGSLPADAARYLKANELDTVGQSGYGAEWAADTWRAELWNRVRQDNAIAPLFPMVEMPTNPWELPLESTDPTVSYVPETTDSSQLTPAASPITLSKVGSGKVTMTAKKLALRIAWSSELNEDSVLPVVRVYRNQAVRALQNAIDNVIVNGDAVVTANTNINKIDGTPGATDKYLAFNGLRKYCLVTNTAQKIDGAGPITVALLRQARFKLDGGYALRPRDCAIIADDLTYAKLLSMPEFATVDKAGAAATNLSGQVGVIDGVPVFASAEMGLSRATDGKISVTAANNTRGSVIIVHRPNWMIGYRRQVQAQVDYLSWADAYHLTVTARLALAWFDAVSAAQVYNLDT